MATRGITGNAVERAKLALAEHRAKLDAAADKRRVERKQLVAERHAAGLTKRGRPRVNGRKRAAENKAKRAEYAKASRERMRAELVATGQLVPKVRKPRAPQSRPELGGLSLRQSRVIIREFKESLPADQWQRVLEAQPADSPGGQLLAIMSDVKMRDWSLERQCAEAGLKIQDLVRMISDHSLGAALVASTRHVGEVVEGVAESAKSRMLVCELCLDLRDEPDESTYIVVAHPREPEKTLRVECPKCGGVGRVRKEGSPRAVETFLKLHGGLEEQQGPTVNVNTQVNFNSQHSMGVQRGQQLLEQGRLRRAASDRGPIVVTATPITSQNGASE